MEPLDLREALGTILLAHPDAADVHHRDGADRGSILTVALPAREGGDAGSLESAGAG